MIQSNGGTASRGRSSVSLSLASSGFCTCVGRAVSCTRSARRIADRRWHQVVAIGRRDDGTPITAASTFPPCGHGFAALSDMTFTYLVDGYTPIYELGVAWTICIAPTGSLRPSFQRDRRESASGR